MCIQCTKATSDVGDIGLDESILEIRQRPIYIHVNPERSFGGTNGEPPSEASQLRTGGPGVHPRKISKTYIANGAIYVIPELYIVNIISLYCNKTCINYASFITI